MQNVACPSSFPRLPTNLRSACCIGRGGPRVKTSMSMASLVTVALPGCLQSVSTVAAAGDEPLEVRCCEGSGSSKPGRQLTR